MWIPYDIRAALKPTGDRAAIARSEADTAPREYLVGFLVRNPVTQAWELDVAAPSLGPELSWARGTITLSGNDSGKLAEVIYRQQAVTPLEALSVALEDLRLRMLNWGAQIGRGMAVAGWRVADTKHGARWNCTPFRPSTMLVDFDAAGPIDADLAPAASLAQRARNATDAEGRLMAAAGALALCCAAEGPLKLSRAQDLSITREMLVHAVSTEAEGELLGLSVAEFLALVAKQHRRLVSAEGFLAPAPTGFAEQVILARHANLADLLAHRLIQAEIRARNAASVAVTPPPAPLSDRVGARPPC